MCGSLCHRKNSQRRRLRTKKSSVYSVPSQTSMSPMTLPHLHLARSKSSSLRGRPQAILSTLLWPRVLREWSKRQILLLDMDKVHRAMPSDSPPPTRTPSQEPSSLMPYFPQSLNKIRDIFIKEQGLSVLGSFTRSPHR